MITGSRFNHTQREAEAREKILVPKSNLPAAAGVAEIGDPTFAAEAEVALFKMHTFII